MDLSKGLIFDVTGDYDLASSSLPPWHLAGCTLFIREKRHLPPVKRSGAHTADSVEAPA